MKQYRKGLFALSADPITYGHLETMRLATEQCEELVVLIANNDEKLASYSFSLEERFGMTQKAVKEYGLENTRVLHSDGLLTDVFMKERCDIVFRGIRHEYDIVGERELAKLYAHIYEPIADKFIFLETPEQYSHVSSSWVKHFVRLGVNVSPYVPLFVKEALERRLNNRMVIGVTGELAVGKSYVAENIVATFGHRGQKAHHIEMDALLHALYEEDSPGAQAVRDALAQRFGKHVLSEDAQTVRRAVLADQLFSPDTSGETIQWAQQLVYPHVERLYRNALQGKEGIILVEWAQFVEMDMLSWVNNNMLLVSSSQHQEFAQQRGLSAEYQQGAAQFQLSTQEKRKAIHSAIHAAQSGELIECVNTANVPIDDAVIQQLISMQDRDILGIE